MRDYKRKEMREMFLFLCFAGDGSGGGGEGKRFCGLRCIVL